jgi:hypothetical protein
VWQISQRESGRRGTTLYFKDGNGNDLVPGFDASVLAEAPRIVHTWETKLGPLNMSTGVILVGNFVKVEEDPVPGVHLEDSTAGLNFLSRPGLTFSAENPATDYQSGATFDIDWGINWAPIASIPNLFFGIQGFYITQFTDDEINNVTVGLDGFRLEKIALGLQVIYYFSPKAGIVAKYQRQLDTENGPQGGRFWIQFVVPIGRHR